MLADALLMFDARAIFGPGVVVGPKSRRSASGRPGSGRGRSGSGRRWYLGERAFVGVTEPHGNYFFEVVGCDLCGSSTVDDTHRIRRRSDIPATPNVCRCWSCRNQTSPDDLARGSSTV